MVMFLFSICDMHFGIIKSELILGISVVVERERSFFLDDHALPDTSMRLSDYVL